MKTRPILMSAPMVKALLAGSKTQTRRVCKSYLQTVYTDHPDWRLKPDAAAVHCPYGVPGDHLWVKETFAVCPPEDDAPAASWCIRYRATPDQPIHWRDNGGRYDDDAINGKWHPSIFMSREYSRITLEITEVRAERVQDISEEDAIAEGVSATRLEWWQGFMRHKDGGRGMVEVGGDTPPHWMEAPEKQVETISAVKHYQALWDSINAKRGYGWDLNPWVWVLTFQRVAA